jgi:hypothetical protein
MAFTGPRIMVRVGTGPFPDCRSTRFVPSLVPGTGSMPAPIQVPSYPPIVATHGLRSIPDWRIEQSTRWQWEMGSFLPGRSTVSSGQLMAGENWTMAVLPSGYRKYFLSIVVNGPTVYAGTTSYHGTVYRSTDNGVTWNATPEDGKYSALEIMGQRLIAGTNDGIQISQDGGSTWGHPQAGLTDGFVRSLLVHQSDLFAGTLDGVYVSIDSAATWLPLNSGLPDTAIAALTADEHFVFCGSNGAIWRRELTSYSGLPTAPVLRSPENNAVEQLTTLDLRWGIADLATFFRVQVSTDSTFLSGIVIDSAGFTDTTMRISGLALRQRYFWRLFAGSFRGVGQPGIPWSFTTLMNPPAAPALVSPPPDAIGRFSTLVCHSVPTASSYRFQVSTDPDYVALVFDETLTDTLAVFRPEADRRFYWRVRAINELGPGQFSAVRWFTVPQPVEIVAPEPGATIGRGAMLRWHPVPRATGYRVSIALDSLEFTKSLFKDSLLTDTSFATDGLPRYTMYWWVVTAVYGSFKNESDAPRSFSTREEGRVDIFPLWRTRTVRYAYSRSYIQEIPAIIGNVDTGWVSCTIGTPVRVNDSTVIWEVWETAHLDHHHWSTGGGDMYDVRFSEETSTMFPVRESLSGDHELHGSGRVWEFPWIDPPSEPQRADFMPVFRFWPDTSRRVTQFSKPSDNNEYQVLDFSRSWGVVGRTYHYEIPEFRVVITVNAHVVPLLPTVDVSPVTLPVTSALMQNYPNPFNPSTTVRYALEHRAQVTLSVFNTLGQQVAVLQNGEQEAGFHEVRFDGSNLPSGVYFYRMQSGTFTETKKLVLTK